MIHRVHHINFIVRDLEEAIPVWERILDIEVTSRDHLEQRGADIARFDLGQTWIVLVQPTRPGTEPAEFLEKHGEGFYLLSLETDSLAEEIRRIGEKSFDGAERDGLDDWRVRDLDLSRLYGVRIQLCETGRFE
jgi:methylmalonyl-CoA/ethylmalonyl-CoA epimerase